MSHSKESDSLYTSADEPFRVVESNFDYLLDRPQQLESGAILLVIAGEAEFIVNKRRCPLTVHTEVLILPQEVCMMARKSNDFRVIVFTFSAAMFQEASFRMSSDYFGFIKENMYVCLPENIFRSNVVYLTMVEELYHDRDNRFRETMAINYLQNYLLNSYDKVCRHNAHVEIREADRQNLIFKRFVSLIHEHCDSVRDVSFYANELAISTRYLSAIAQRNCQMSAKAFIDDCVTQEIKLRLQSTDLSIQEIADQLNFSDQSYLGRFFKRQTGISPSEYRLDP